MNAPVMGIAQERTAMQDADAHAYQEKIYVHQDRSFYLDKETMWLKIYVLKAADKGFSDLSKVAYVELMDRNNLPRVQVKVALQNGTGNATIQFPENLPSGNYRLRAYTQWMKNFEPGNYFETTISFINTSQTFDTTFLDYQPRYSLRFYPSKEKDDYNSQRILFTVQDDYGNRLQGSGIVLNEQRDTITQLKTLVPGFGHFDLPQTSGGSFLVEMHLSNGDSLKQAIPAQILSANSPNKKAKGGSDNQITNSRLEQYPVKAGNKRNVPLILTGLQNSYPQRSKVSFDLQLDGTLTTKVAQLSMAVYLLDTLNARPIKEEVAYADFETFVEGEFPGLANGNNTDESLLKELWQVYRKDFTVVPSDRRLKYVPEYNGHIIRAQITDAASGNPVAGVTVYLSIPGNTVQLHVCNSDEQGMVHFDMPHFYGNQSIMLQTEMPGKYALRVLIPFSSDVSHQPVPKLFLDRAEQEALIVRYRQMNIVETFLHDSLHKVVDTSQQTLSIYGKPDKEYLLDNYRRFITMEEVLREYVREVNVISRKQDYQLRVFNSRVYQIKDYINGVNDFMYHSDPFIFLDGIPVFQTNKFMAYDPLKVKRLEVVTSGYHFGPAFKKGIISAFTYKNNAEGFTLASGALLIDYEGLQEPVAFHSPEYEEENDHRIPDYRNLLFWNANINAGKQNKSIQFFTGDVKGNYQIVIRGFTSAGEPVFLTQTFSVE